MLKRILQSIAKKAGYKIITNDHYSRMFDISCYSDFDCLYLLKDIYGQNSQLTFIDIGANEGQTSIKFSRNFNQSKIYCFEPFKDTYSVLLNNLQPYPNVSSYQLAMGESEGRLEVYHTLHSQWNTLVPATNEILKNRNATSEMINVTTVDTFCETNSIERIHLLKSDTEGFEREVINGSRKMLESKMIDMYYVEVRFNDGDKQHNNWLDIVKIMTNYQYYFAGLFEINYVDKIRIGYANALFVCEPATKIKDNF